MSDQDPDRQGEAEARPGPVLSVVAGHPNDEEIAALAVVFAALAAATPRGGGGRKAGEHVSTAWNQPIRRMRPPVRPGPRAWRRNALPH